MVTAVTVMRRRVQLGNQIGCLTLIWTPQIKSISGSQHVYSGYDQPHFLSFHTNSFLILDSNLSSILIIIIIIIII